MRSKSILILLLTALNAFAGANRWTNSGPDGAAVTAMTADPANDAVIFAATYNGVFNTIDRGGHWTAVNRGLPDETVLALAFRPGTRSLYAGTKAGRLFRSDDSAEHWNEVTAPSINPIQAIAFAPAGGSMYVTAGNTVFRSADDATTWTGAQTSIRAVQSLLVLVNGDLYAGGDGLYHSVDQGHTFSRVGPTGVYVSAIAADSQAAYLAPYAQGSLGIFKSVDGWKTWEVLPAFPAPSPPGGILQLGIRQVVPTANGLVAATSDGVFEYSNDDKAWSRVGTLSGYGVSSLVVSSSSARPLVAGTSAGAVTIGPRDQDWTWANGGLTGALTQDVLFDPTSSSSMLAASARGIFIRENGDPWQLLHPVAFPAAVAVAQQQPPAIFVGSARGVEKSSDSGKTWKLVTPKPGVFASRLGISPADPSTIYASLVSGLYKSTDGGDSFNAMQGLPFDYYGFYTPGFAVDPLSAERVFVGEDYGVYKTETGGTSWDRVSAQFASSLAIDPVNPSIIYAGTYNDIAFNPIDRGGVIKSTDGGLTWNASGLDGETIATLAIDPQLSSIIYAASSAGKIFRSANGGESWNSFDSGLDRSQIFKLAVDATGRRLLAATTRGVYEYQRDLTYLSGAVTYAISLRTLDGNYVSAAFCGDSYVTANSTAVSTCETFTLYDINGGTLRDGDKVYLQAANGSFLSAEFGGSNGCGGCDSPLNANRIVAASWETFTIHRSDGGDRIVDGTPINLQSSAGNYVVAESGGGNSCSCDSRVLANRVIPREWETFTVSIR